ncbi:MAG: tetratricopeptide repeat protein, partial [Alphaproteobacteria bacterium]|nr:tetratricopeptide repeat protein [Alphaproteobacteria bacterium]
LGEDDKAVGYYEKAIELGLKASDLKSAILSLGISYHCLGLMEKSRRLIEAAVSHFPDDKPLQIFKFVANSGLANDKQTIKSHLDHFARELENLDITDLEVALKKFTNNLQPIAAE